MDNKRYLFIKKRFTQYINSFSSFSKLPIFLFIVSYLIAGYCVLAFPKLSSNILLSCTLSWSYFLLLVLLNKYRKLHLNGSKKTSTSYRQHSDNIKLKSAIILCTLIQFYFSILSDGEFGVSTISYLALLFFTYLIENKSSFFNSSQLHPYNQFFPSTSSADLLLFPLFMWWLTNLLITNNDPSFLLNTLILLFLSCISLVIINYIIDKYKRNFFTLLLFTFLLLLLSLLSFFQLYLIKLAINYLSYWSLLMIAPIYLLFSFRLLLFIYSPNKINDNQFNISLILYIFLGYINYIVNILIKNDYGVYQLD